MASSQEGKELIGGQNGSPINGKNEGLFGRIVNIEERMIYLFIVKN